MGIISKIIAAEVNACIPLNISEGIPTKMLSIFTPGVFFLLWISLDFFVELSQKTLLAILQVFLFRFFPVTLSELIVCIAPKIPSSVSPYIYSLFCFFIYSKKKKNQQIICKSLKRFFWKFFQAFLHELLEVFFHRLFLIHFDLSSGILQGFPRNFSATAADINLKSFLGISRYF